MPMIWIPATELRALQAIFNHDEQVDWEAYDRAKTYVIEASSQPQEKEPDPEPVIG